VDALDVAALLLQPVQLVQVLRAESAREVRRGHEAEQIGPLRAVGHNLPFLWFSAGFRRARTRVVRF